MMVMKKSSGSSSSTTKIGRYWRMGCIWRLLVLWSFLLAGVGVAGAARPLGSAISGHHQTTSLNTPADEAFTGKEVENCLPKGFQRHSSAPSRYTNYQTLGRGAASAATATATAFNEISCDDQSTTIIVHRSRKEP